MDNIEEVNKRGKQLAEEHWAYLEQVLQVADVTNTDIDIIGFHYKTAMVHGYKHAWEDMYNEAPKGGCSGACS